LQAYQQHLDEIAALGATLVAVSPQTPDNSLSMTEKGALGFPVLSDEGNRVARDYRLHFTLSEVLQPIYAKIGIDLPVFNGDGSWPLPVPGTFVIGTDGIVRSAFVDADYTHRLEPSAILDVLRGMLG